MDSNISAADILLSPRGETSSLRTQLIEAQILDSQLGEEDNLIDTLLAKSCDIDEHDFNVRND